MFKFLAFLIFLMNSISSLACTYDKAPFQDIYSDLLNAKTIMLVKVKGDSFKRSFSSEKPWEPITLDMYHGPCSVAAAPGRKYLFLSYRSIGDLKKDQLEIGSYNGIMIDLNELKNDIKKLSSKKELPEGHANVFWSYCHEDKECTKFKNFCGEKIGVNKEYELNLKNYYKNSSTKCDKKAEIVKKSKCVENFCS